MITSPYLRNGRARIDLWPVSAFDHPDGRLRGPLDPEHRTLSWLLGRSFAGIANRPEPSALYRWIIAPSRTPHQRAWVIDVLKVAATRPAQLATLVREDAISIHDLAVVIDEANCNYGLLTDWLNKYAIPPPRSQRLNPSGTAARPS